MARKKLKLSPPPTVIDNGLDTAWNKWFSMIQERVGEGPFMVRGYYKASLPPAQDWYDSSVENSFTGLIMVVDSTPPTIAFSNGTDWLSLTDGSIV